MTVSTDVAAKLAQVRRIVAMPEAAINETDRASLKEIASTFWEDPLEVPTMPFGYGSRNLADAAGQSVGSWDEASGYTGRREQVFAAWDIRLNTDATDQARIGARIDELLQGAPATIQSSRGIAELRTLLHVMEDPRHVPTELGIANASDLDQYLDAFVVGDVERRRPIGVKGVRLITNWQTVQDPERLAAWKTAVDRTARDGSPLPDDATIELLVAPASGWANRTHDERLRLLEAMATSGGRVTTAHSRQADHMVMSRYTHPEVFEHLDGQIERTLRDGVPLPDGITAYHVTSSPVYEAATSAERVRLLDAYQPHATQPLFQELILRHVMLPDTTAYAKAQVTPILRAALDGDGTLPSWMRIGDVLDDSLTEVEQLRLLQPFLSSTATDTPGGALAWMLDAKHTLGKAAVGDGSAMADQLRVRSLARIDANIERIRGGVSDGATGHPDYGDIGRIMSDMELLDGLARAARERAVVSAKAAPTNAAGAATLTW